MTGHIKFQDNGQLNGLFERVSEAGVFDYFLNNTLLFTLTPASGTVAADLTGNLVTGTVTRKVREVVVTATQLRKCRAQPVTLVPAVAGSVLIFQGMYVIVDIVTVFDSVGAGEDLAVYHEDEGGMQASAALNTTTDIDFTQASLDQRAWLPPLAATVLSGVSILENLPLVLLNKGAGELATTDDDSDGNATMTCTIVYLEIAV